MFMCIHVHNIHIYRKMHAITFKEEGGHEFEKARGDIWQDLEGENKRGNYVIIF